MALTFITQGCAAVSVALVVLLAQQQFFWYSDIRLPVVQGLPISMRVYMQTMYSSRWQAMSSALNCSSSHHPFVTLAGSGSTARTGPDTIAAHFASGTRSGKSWAIGLNKSQTFEDTDSDSFVESHPLPSPYHPLSCLCFFSACEGTLSSSNVCPQFRQYMMCCIMYSNKVEHHPP